MIDSKFSKNLQIAREKVGLTQVQVAEKVGINVNYYARVERGLVPAIKTLRVIAKVLRVNPNDLFKL